MGCSNVLFQETVNKAELNRAEIIAAAILELVLYTEKETVARNIALDDIQGCVRDLYCFLEDDNYGVLNSILNDETAGNYTIKHSINVCKLAMMIAKNMGNSQREVIDIGTAALLHDVGKRFIGRSIIYKNGVLTEEERKCVNLHPIYGSSHIKSVFPDVTSDMALGILYHHERIDEKGYPEGRRFGIPYFARVIAVADVFEAYMAKRPYHERRTLTEGVKFLMKHEGLDKAMVRCLVSMFF